MARKKGSTLLEQAIKNVPGFAGLWHKMNRRMTLAGQSPSTLKNYGRSLAQMALHFEQDPTTVDEEEVQEYLYSLVKAKKFSESYFKFAVYALRYAYKTVGIEQRLTELPEIRRQNKLPVVLSKQECRELFAAPKLLKHRVLLAFVYSTGLRMNEARKLLLSDIDAHRMQVRVRQGKGMKDRYVVLSPLVLNGLRKYFRACRPVKFLFNGQTPGEPLGSRSIQWMLGSALRKTRIKKQVTMHTLRHSFATHLLEDGVDLVTIKEQLGHARIETTMRYLHIARVRKSAPHSPFDTLYKKS